MKYVSSILEAFEETCPEGHELVSGARECGHDECSHCSPDSQVDWKELSGIEEADAVWLGVVAEVEDGVGGDGEPAVEVDALGEASES